MIGTRKEPNYSILWFLLATGFVLVIWLQMWRYADSLGLMSDELGQFGDSFGFANSVFSALAFAGVIVTVFFQTAELRLQREDLRETQSTLKETAEANKQSQEHLRLTSFIQGASVLIEELGGESKGIYSGLTSGAALAHSEFLKIHLDYAVYRLTSEFGEVPAGYADGIRLLRATDHYLSVAHNRFDNKPAKLEDKTKELVGELTQQHSPTLSGEALDALRLSIAPHLRDLQSALSEIETRQPSDPQDLVPNFINWYLEDVTEHATNLRKALDQFLSRASRSDG